MPNAKESKLDAVIAVIRALDPSGARIARLFRDTFDQLYDGQHTGRYCWEQLYGTEKKFSGSIVKMNLQREFKFEAGIKLDFRIAGIDLCCEFSLKINGWMIPPEAKGHLCLVVWAEDSSEPKGSVGLVRINDANLSKSDGNRDGKKYLSQEGKDAIVWLFKNVAIPPNVLLQLDRETVDKILSQKSGQKKVNDLFRVALGMRVGRAVVATVGKQVDYMKRIRGNLGARSALKKEGILILGQYHAHRDIARSLGIHVPGPGESISVRVIPANAPGKGVAEINGQFWRLAQTNDSSVPAPTLSRPKRKTTKA